jgi:hypothetical protein
MSAGAKAWRRPAALVLVLCAAACAAGPTTNELEAVAARWFEAIHARDFEQLARYDLSAPIVREGPMFAAWTRAVEGVLRSYERQRDDGVLEPDPQGYQLVEAVQLGRGAFWETLGRGRTDEGRPVLRIRVNFGYGDVNYLTLPAGTTVYLLGHPVGTLHAIQLGRHQRLELDVLEHMDFRVVYGRAEGDVEGDAPWKVDRIEWVPASAVHREVRWIF